MLHARQDEAQRHFQIEVQRGLTRSIQLWIQGAHQLNHCLRTLHRRSGFRQFPPGMALQNIAQLTRAYIGTQQVGGQRSVVFHAIQLHAEHLELVIGLLGIMQPLTLFGISQPRGERGVVLRI